MYPRDFFMGKYPPMREFGLSWHCVRELKLFKHFPEQYFEGRIMTREVRILCKRRATRQHVRDAFGSFATELTKGVISLMCMGLTCVIDLCRC